MLLRSLNKVCAELHNKTAQHRNLCSYGAGLGAAPYGRVYQTSQMKSSSIVDRSHRVPPNRSWQGGFLGRVLRACSGQNITQTPARGIMPRAVTVPPDKVRLERLRKSEALLAQAEQIGLMGCWEHDLVTGEDAWSDNLCRMVGIDRSATKLSEDLFWELVHPDDREAVRMVIECAMKDRQEYEYQARFILPGGCERTFYTRGKPILGPDQQIVKRMGMTQDITVRVEVERALLESEERYRDLVENSHDLICTHDLDGRLLSMNELPAQLLGYRREELVGRSIADLLYPEARAEFGEYVERINRDGCASGLMALQAKSGERRIWKFHNTLRVDGVPAPVVRGMAHDVTEEVEARRALKESTATLQAVLDSIDEIAFEFDAHGIFLDFWTTKECPPFRPRAQLIGKPVSEVFGEAFAAHCRSAFKRVLESGKSEDIEYSMPLMGADHWFLCRVSPIVAEDGSYKSVCMLARDITERKKSEQALRLFRVLIDRSNDAIEVVDPVSLRFLDVNDKACSDLGYAREEILCMGVRDIDSALSAESHAKVLKELEQKGWVMKEAIHRRKDGSEFPVEINLNLVRLDRDYIVAVVRDITRRKRAEAALREERDRAQQYLDIVDVILLALDLNGKITLINRKGCSLLEWQEHELLGRDWFDTCLPASTRERMHPLFHSLLAGDFSYVENPVLTKSGEERLIGWRNTLLRDEEGQVIGTLSSGEDITDRRASEKALWELSGKLLHAQDEERRRIARDVHDGIGQYVAGLSLAIGKLRSCIDQSDLDSREALACCRALIRDASREIRTVSYLLHPPMIDELGLKSALEWLVRGYRERSGIRVSLETSARLTRLTPEIEIALFRVAQESLSNVYRHSESPTAAVRLVLDLDTVMLEVADHGKGLVSKPRGSKYRAGVGIPGMQERVKELRGRFTLESSPEQGVKVQVILPLTSDG